MKTELPKGTRQVCIELRDKMWMVRYLHRTKHSRYCAACFYAPDHSEADVIRWVQSQPGLTLATPHDQSK